MILKRYGLLLAAGFLAGCVNGLFGAGGGMVLVPLLGICGHMNEEEIFPSSVIIISSVCLLCLLLYARSQPLPWNEALPYLLGSLAGGTLSGLFGKKIPVTWLHRGLGAMIIWGGIRYLC